MSAVIARSEATKQSILSLCRTMDCFAFARNDGVRPWWFVEIRIRYLRSPRIIAAPFSAIIAVGVFVFPEVIVGITDASAMRSPAIP
jgi:hypothetical protein